MTSRGIAGSPQGDAAGLASPSPRPAAITAAAVLLAAPFGPANPGHAATPVATVAQGPGVGGGAAGELLSSPHVTGAGRGELPEVDSRVCGTASQAIEDTASIDASLPRSLSSTGS